MSQSFLIALILILSAAAVLLAVVLSRRRGMSPEDFEATARARALQAGAGLTLIRGKRPKLRLTVPASGRGQFEVNRESAADRLVEGAGLARLIAVPDPAFGRRFHVDSDDEAFATAFFSDAAKRAAVEAVFAAGFTSLIWDGASVTAEWPDFAPGDDVEFVSAAASGLSALTRNVARASAEPAAADGWSEKAFTTWGGRATLGGVVLLYVLIFFHRALPGRPVDGGTFLLTSLRFSAPAAAAAAALILSRVRGKTWFLKATAHLLAASALAVPPAGYLACELANSLLDRAPAESFELPVVGKYRSSGKHTVYYIDVPPWRADQRKPDFEVDSFTFNRVRQNVTKARLTVRPGFLGAEWIVSLDFVD